MPLLAHASLTVAQHLSGFFRNELLQQLHVAVVQHQVLVPTDRTGIARGDKASANARLPGLLRGVHAFVIAPVKRPHGTVAIGFLVGTALQVPYARFDGYGVGSVNWGTVKSKNLMSIT